MKPINCLPIIYRNILNTFYLIKCIQTLHDGRIFVRQHQALLAQPEPLRLKRPSAQHQHRNVRMRQHLLGFTAQEQSLDAFSTV